MLRTVQLRIQKSEDSVFHISEIKFSRGASPEMARNAATKIDFPVDQTDSIINLPRGFNISRSEKFRNQQVLLVIDIPVGKKIEIDRVVSEYSGFNLELGEGYNDWDWNDDWHNNYDWRSNVEYIMTSDGLKPTHPDQFRNEDEYGNTNEQPEGDSTGGQVQDSSRYHYQPSNDSPAAPVKKTKALVIPAKIKRLLRYLI